ncbi:MAG TPA: shikimate kinase, partial [Pirellulales bacterium]|nr:shikimate kinase [Pirellulales bacterium]
NTDRSAAIESLAAALGRSTGRGGFKGLSALVLGAGGAARAIAHGLVQSGARTIVASRTQPRADDLARAVGCEVVAWDDRHTPGVDVLVNCTPIGMSPNVEETPYDASRLRPETVVFDTVYNPERTRLLREAGAGGCRTVSGIEMFIRQGALQFELFTGTPAPRDVMRTAITASVLSPFAARKRSIVLIGYRGSGKSAVAASLARRLGWQAIDADLVLEERAGKSIAEIFRDGGEQVFRELESQVIGELVERDEVVIAAGGGVVLRDGNRSALGRAEHVIWLRAAVPTLLERVNADPATAARRPNLTTQGGEAEVRALLAQREPLYRQCAAATVDTDGKTPDAIAAEIVQWLAGNRRK